MFNLNRSNGTYFIWCQIFFFFFFKKKGKKVSPRLLNIKQWAAGSGCVQPVNGTKCKQLFYFLKHRLYYFRYTGTGWNSPHLNNFAKGMMTKKQVELLNLYFTRHPNIPAATNLKDERVPHYSQIVKTLQ